MKRRFSVHLFITQIQINCEKIRYFVMKKSRRPDGGQCVRHIEKIWKKCISYIRIHELLFYLIVNHYSTVAIFLRLTLKELIHNETSSNIVGRFHVDLTLNLIIFSLKIGLCYFTMTYIRTCYNKRIDILFAQANNV